MRLPTYLSAAFTLTAVLVVGMAATAQENLTTTSTNATSSTGATTSTSTSGSGGTSHLIISDSDNASKSKFGILLYTLGGVDDSQFKQADPAYTIYDAYLSFSLKLPSDIRIAFLPAFGYTTTGYDNRGAQTTDKFSWRDLSFSAAQYDILDDYLPASMALKQKARLYLPTTDNSKDEGMIARLRLEFEAYYNFSRYSGIRAYVKPSYYFQRTTAYYDSFTGKLKTTRKWDSQHGSEVNWSLNKYFSIKPGFEIEDKFSNESQVNNRDDRHTSEVSYRLGFEVRPTREFNFTLGIQDKRDLIDPSTTPTVSYSLLTNLVLY